MIIKEYTKEYPDGRYIEVPDDDFIDEDETAEVEQDG